MPKRWWRTIRRIDRLSTFWPGARTERLLLEWTQEALRMAVSPGRGQIAARRSICLRETPEENILAEIREFCVPRPFSETVLIVPRNFLIDRSMEVPLKENGGRSEMRAALRKAVEEALPVPLFETARAIRAEREGTGLRVHLSACPLSCLDPVLRLLSDAGLKITEIVSSEEALLSFSREKYPEGAALAVSFDGDSFEIVARDTSGPSSKFFHAFSADAVREIQFALLECRRKPERILMFGADAAIERLLRENLDLPVESFPAGEGVTAALAGASCLGKQPYMSLLPDGMKQARDKRRCRLLAAKTAGAAICAGLALVAGVVRHQTLLSAEAGRIEAEIRQLKKRAIPVLELGERLQRLVSRSRHNRSFLDLLQYLSGHMPQGTAFQQIEWDEDSFRATGSSRDYSGVTELVRELENSESLKSPRLDYARLRRKNSRDYFEFSIRAGCVQEAPVERKRPLKGDPDPLRAKKSELARVMSDAARGPRYRGIYERYFTAPQASSGPDKPSRTWLKELGVLLESRGMRVLKLEPAGTDDFKNNIPEMKAALQIEGEWRALVSILREIAAEYRNRLLSVRLCRPDKGFMVCDIQVARMEGQFEQIKNPGPP